MIKRKNLPSFDYLKKCFRYDLNDGCLIWNERPLSHFKTSRGHAVFNSNYANKIAGVVQGNGYWVVRINGINYLAHRVIWKLIKGADPIEEIDHIDGIKSNNKIENLREASHLQNMKNQSARVTNKLGIKGVSLKKRCAKFVAQIRVNGKNKHLGYFDTPELAANAYREANLKFNKEFGGL